VLLYHDSWYSTSERGRHATIELVFGVAPTDPTSILGAAILLMLVGVTASWIPARRASKVSPMESLRAE